MSSVAPWIVEVSSGDESHTVGVDGSLSAMVRGSLNRWSLSPLAGLESPSPLEPSSLSKRRPAPSSLTVRPSVTRSLFVVPPSSGDRPVTVGASPSTVSSSLPRMPSTVTSIVSPSRAATTAAGWVPVPSVDIQGSSSGSVSIAGSATGSLLQTELRSSTRSVDRSQTVKTPW